MSKNANGFTLIELLIVVVIIGVLAAIALPSYQRYVSESRRIEAQATLIQLAMAQEKWRTSNVSYGYLLASGALTASSAAAATFATTYYNFTITNVSGSSFTINATAVGGQATSDAACTPITLNQNNAKGPSGCWKS